MYNKNYILLIIAILIFIWIIYTIYENINKNIKDKAIGYRVRKHPNLSKFYEVSFYDYKSKKWISPLLIDYSYYFSDIREYHYIPSYHYSLSDIDNSIKLYKNNINLLIEQRNKVIDDVEYRNKNLNEYLEGEEKEKYLIKNKYNL